MVTFHFYLRSDRGKTGKAPVYLRITKDRKYAVMSTGVKVDPADWNDDLERVADTHTNAKHFNAVLDVIEGRARQVQALFMSKGTVTAVLIRDRLKEVL